LRDEGACKKRKVSSHYCKESLQSYNIIPIKVSEPDIGFQLTDSFFGVGGAGTEINGQQALGLAAEKFVYMERVEASRRRRYADTGVYRSPGK